MNSYKLAPFRKWTRGILRIHFYFKGYTGNNRTFRDDPFCELEKIEEVIIYCFFLKKAFNMIEAFQQKDFRLFEASKINSTLRGKIFLFTDFILTKQFSNLEEKEIEMIIEYIKKYLEFAIIFLKNFAELSTNVIFFIF